MRRALRAAAYVLLPAELVLVVCVVAGVRIPGGVLLGAEALVLALLVAEVVMVLRLRRAGLGTREALRELVPERVRRLAGHELRLLHALLLWAARRRHGTGPGVRAFGHAADQAALMYGFAFVCLVETAGMSYLLRNLPVLHAVVLVLDVYTVLFVLGLHAASVTRPHTLDADGVRLRQAAHVDVRVPWEQLEEVRYELVFTHPAQEGVLDLAVGSQTSVTVRLREPVAVRGLLGATRRVHTVRCHADDARAFTAALGEGLRRARTAPSPSPGRPG
ncbi:hypothetical protein ABT160_01660 [Streptomyces sp. NPDC001941]|uniref:hypothetical protein n=1 Tax=Streptomyces sp. NPDC001941 TaxID=3154659 RepID=UPI00331C4879